MKSIRRTFAVVCAVSGALVASQTFAADPEPGVSLTVYSAADPAGFDPQAYMRAVAQNPYYAQQVPMPGYGVVRDVRKVTLDPNNTQLRFTDVAAGIDPTTVKFRSFTDPATSVLEQNFEYDLVNSQKLLKRYVDKQVIVEREVDGRIETITGTLLSADAGLILRDRMGAVRILNSYSGISLADAADLITKPTLVWNLNTKTPGEHLTEVSYQTDGITWRADYSLILNVTDTAADVSSWVTLLNQSGAAYKNAQLKLVAGDVQRVKPNEYADRRWEMAMDAGAMPGRGPGFAQKSFFEYHLYTLGRPTTIEQNSIKQIELFEPRDAVPTQKVFVYYGTPEARFWNWDNVNTDRNLGTQTNKKVDTYVRFKNDEKSSLGIPLPAGRVRVYKRDDADGSIEFIGEDVIQHTPKDESVLIKLGSAFDLVGERKQIDFQVNEQQRWLTESFEIVVKNRKEKDPATIIVKENLYRWGNWEIPSTSQNWEKQDSRTIHFTVDLRPGEEKTVKYTVKYSW
jgi:hypothetical protein